MFRNLDERIEEGNRVRADSDWAKCRSRQEGFGLRFVKAEKVHSVLNGLTWCVNEFDLGEHCCSSEYTVKEIRWNLGNLRLGLYMLEAFVNRGEVDVDVDELLSYVDYLERMMMMSGEDMRGIIDGSLFERKEGNMKSVRCMFKLFRDEVGRV